jgi:hypothetical protein
MPTEIEATRKEQREHSKSKRKKEEKIAKKVKGKRGGN